MYRDAISDFVRIYFYEVLLLVFLPFGSLSYERWIFHFPRWSSHLLTNNSLLCLKTDCRCVMNFTIGKLTRLWKKTKTTTDRNFIEYCNSFFVQKESLSKIQVSHLNETKWYCVDVILTIISFHLASWSCICVLVLSRICAWQDNLILLLLLLSSPIRPFFYMIRNKISACFFFSGDLSPFDKVRI